MSNYRLLIDLTSEILTKRTKCYRRLVIAFIAISLISVCIIVVTMSLWYLAGLLLLIPAYSFYLVCDNHLLNQWRKEVSNAWKTKAIDLNAFRQALSANKALLQQTLQGMLDTIPDAGDLISEQSVSENTRKALSDLLMARDNNLQNKILCKLMLHSILIIVIITALVMDAWMLLSAIVMIPILLLICAWQNRRGIFQSIKRVVHHSESSDFDCEKYKEIAHSINWSGLSLRDKVRFLIQDHEL